MQLIYIAGPYTNGDVAKNVHTAIQAAHIIMDNGMYPYCHHLSHFQHLLFAREYDDWIQLDLVWLRKCDALVRIPGESPGADREEALARDLGMRVYTGLNALLEAKGLE